MANEQGKEQKDKRSNSPFASYKVVHSNLAPIIMEYASPMLAHCTTFEARCEAISYAVLCWNLALDEESERQRIEEQIKYQYPPEESDQILKLIDFLIQRKNRLYPDNRFYIIDYEINQRDKNIELRVTTKYLPRK